MQTDSTPEIKTIHGRAVPSIGFGTFQLKRETCYQAVLCALESGYRHVDTARMYANEGEVGRALRDAGVPREDIFLTSKVWMDQLRADETRKSVHESLKDLGVDVLDLVLIHWPAPEVPLAETLGALTRLQDEGKVRHVGVSNFTLALLAEACEYARVFCNQVEYHPVLGQEKLLDSISPLTRTTTTKSPPSPKTNEGSIPRSPPSGIEGLQSRTRLKSLADQPLPVPGAGIRKMVSSTSFKCSVRSVARNRTTMYPFCCKRRSFSRSRR